MKLQIQSVHFTADQKLLDFTQSKLDKLERFDETLKTGDVIFSIDKDNDKGNKCVVVKLQGQTEYIAERQTTTFEDGIDQCIDALKKQIEKHKNK